ncbi:MULTISPECIES: hypothetical protein [Pseudomonas]|uniref:Uncharacterized protein n=1 Tax=Pseudomonas quercus TaxID=2722792 RepID=A0ABX0Y8B1_9PSED|nr:MULTISPECIES: hypothetical protein [Pseudomonas]MBF7141016.1 hypothetical protein [Pseudomonas sp. LY10J]NJO99550.1 hypothetical protein [Pseudomonas quercus]
MTAVTASSTVTPLSSLFTGFVPETLLETRPALQSMPAKQVSIDNQVVPATSASEPVDVPTLMDQAMQRLADLEEEKLKALNERVSPQDKDLPVGLDMSGWGNDMVEIYALLIALQQALQANAKLSGQMMIMAHQMAANAGTKGVEAARANLMGQVMGAVVTAGLAAGSLGLHAKASTMAHKNMKANDRPALANERQAQREEAIVGSAGPSHQDSQVLLSSARKARNEAAEQTMQSKANTIDIQLTSNKAVTLGSLAMVAGTLTATTQQPVSAKHEAEKIAYQQSQSVSNEGAQNAAGEKEKTQKAIASTLQTVQQIENSRIAAQAAIANARS